MDYATNATSVEVMLRLVSEVKSDEMATAQSEKMATFCTSRRFEMQTRRRDVASLIEENQRLRVQLKRFDMARQQAERQVIELQDRVHQAETAIAQRLRLKETEWMAEYDRSVQALLQIVEHHEDERAQLTAEVERLKAEAAVVPPSITKMARSIPTEIQAPLKVMLKRNSVHFTKQEDEVASDKEDSPSANVRKKASIARMQQLFEQIQHASKCVNRQNSCVNEELDSKLCVSKSSHKFKAAVLERLGEHQIESHKTRRRQRATSAIFEAKKSIETQTEISNPEMPFQKDLEERNRLLTNRLASQQKVLDQLLHSKLKKATNNVEQYESVSSSSSDTVRDITGNEQTEAEPNFEHTRPTMIPELRLSLPEAQNDDIPAERRPLSPPAA